MKKILLLTLSVLFLASSLWAAFDRLPPSLTDNPVLSSRADAIFYNPALLVRGSGMSSSIAYLMPYAESELVFVSGAFSYPLGRWGTVALGLTNFSTSSLSNEFRASFGHSLFLEKKVTYEIAGGYSLNIYNLSFGKSITGVSCGSASAVDLSLGLYGSVNPNISFGFFGDNLLAANFSGEQTTTLERRLIFGASYAPYEELTGFVSVERPEGRDTRFCLGVRFLPVDWARVYSSVKSSPEVFSLGLEFGKGSFWFGYAVSTHPRLPVSHTVGISYEG